MQVQIMTQAWLNCDAVALPINWYIALKSRSTTLKTSSKPLILHRQNRTWQKIRAVKLLPSVTARILAESIAHDLLWCCIVIARELWKGPSWSWISVNGQVFFTYTDYNWDEGVSLCWIEEKLDADVQIHQQNLLRIGNPALHLKGHLNKGTLGFDKSQTAEEFRPRLSISTFELSKVEFWPDAMLETVSVIDDNGIVHQYYSEQQRNQNNSL